MRSVTLIREKGLSIITLNRPEVYNALNIETLERLLEVIKIVERNDDKVVLLTGTGKAFCAGGDVSVMGGSNNEVIFQEMMNVIEDITLTLYMMPKIVITAVNGSAAGLGLSLALNSDYIVAQKEAKFGMLFAGIGLIPDGGGHFFLKERLGTHRAKLFIWNLKQISGEEAYALGIVDILSDENAKEAALKLARQIQSTALKAIIQTKIILHNDQKEKLHSFLQEGKQSQLKMAKTIDHQEGVRAFLEKRKAQFLGK